MTGKIYPSIFISLLFHSLFIIILIFSVRNSVVDFKNTTYVTLIQNTGNTGSTQQTSGTNEETRTIPEKPSIQKKKEISEKAIEKTSRVSKAEEELLQERLSALRAKKKIVESRLMAKNQTGYAKSGGSGSNKEEGASSSYLALISGLIRQNWNIPDTVPKNLEAVISVRILSNGQIIIEGFEKSSGNTLFDSSVMRAIKISSPLPPPKGEIKVGLRFKP